MTDDPTKPHVAAPEHGAETPMSEPQHATPQQVAEVNLTTALFGADKNQQGIDYASVDENPAPNDAVLAHEGERFAIIRKGYGFWDSGHRAFRLAADPVYARDAQHARDAGLVVGAYLFPIYHVGAPTAAEQVANFLQAAGEIKRGIDLPPVVDVEFPGRGIADTGMTQGQAYTFTLDLIFELKKATGVDPIVYTSHVEWCDTNGLGGPKDLGGHDCPLWVKIPYHLAAQRAPDTSPHIEPHVGAAEGDRADLFRIPPPWEKSGWWIRQFQGDEQGLPGVHQADLDDFHVTRQGDTGPHVAWLQRKLGLVADGSFGPVTSEAVRAFQEAHGLDNDGIVGVRTFAAIAWQ